ncbi:uncharacterized protein [Acropora muricata]|uniref:uncharacterized protein isoform X2 n=1 Tax=Acropora muricata TaxID=159855 RepID=UPI0034E41867
MRFLLVIFAIGFLVTLAYAGQRTRIRPGKKDTSAEEEEEGLSYWIPVDAASAINKIPGNDARTNFPRPGRKRTFPKYADMQGFIRPGRKRRSLDD